MNFWYDLTLILIIKLLLYDDEQDQQGHRICHERRDQP